MGRPNAEDVASTVHEEFGYEYTVESNSEFYVHNVDASDATSLSKFVSVRGFNLYVGDIENAQSADLRAEASE